MRTSIRARLTLWYVGVFAVILLLFAGGSFLFLRHRLYAELDRTLAADFERGETEAETVVVSGRRTIMGIAVGVSEREAGEPWLEVRDVDGVVVRRVGRGALPDTPDGYASAVLADGTPVRILSRRETFDDAPPVRIRVGALGGRGCATSWDEYLLVAGISLPLAILLVGFAGSFLARRALAPVDRLVARARAVTAENPRRAPAGRERKRRARPPRDRVQRDVRRGSRSRSPRRSGSPGTPPTSCARR